MHNEQIIKLFVTVNECRDCLDDFLSVLITSQRSCFDEIVLRLSHQFANTYVRLEFTMRPAYFITYRGHLPRDIYVTIAGRKKRVKGMKPVEKGDGSGFGIELVGRKKSSTLAQD